MACRRSGNGLWILLVFLLDLLGTTASNMEPIYWNSLNESLNGRHHFPRCSANLSEWWLGLEGRVRGGGCGNGGGSLCGGHGLPRAPPPPLLAEAIVRGPPLWSEARSR
ncbi:hypothetical protein CRENBAI_012357 [Crenichthys baileyi]|uniref:Uncharacterized protein n=1 Tax=Crenichthys baileyi TaxID=28760 RepID=A0AAV9S6K5_9TELE